MDANDLLDAIGQVEDEYIMRARETRKNTFRLGVLVACMLLFVMIAVFFPSHFSEPRTESYTEPPQSGNDTLTEQGLLELFCVDNTFYYTTANGRLYQMTENGRKLLKELPSGNLFWAETNKTFYYYDSGSILMWNPETNEETVLTENLPIPDKGESAYFIAKLGEDCFFGIANRVYSYHIPTGEVFSEDRGIDYKIASNEKYYAYLQDNKVMCIDVQTGQKNEVLTLAPLQTITCACIVEDTLFYVSDFNMESVPLSEGGAGCSDWFTPLHDYKYIVAMTYNGENMVFVMEEILYNQQNNIYQPLTKVLQCSRDGTLLTLRETAEPEYVIPGSCRIIATDTQYCFGVRANPIVVMGELNNSRD